MIILVEGLNITHGHSPKQAVSSRRFQRAGSGPIFILMTKVSGWPAFDDVFRTTRIGGVFRNGRYERWRGGRKAQHSREFSPCASGRWMSTLHGEFCDFRECSCEGRRTRKRAISKSRCASRVRAGFGVQEARQSVWKKTYSLITLDNIAFKESFRAAT